MCIFKKQKHLVVVLFISHVLQNFIYSVKKNNCQSNNISILINSIKIKASKTSNYAIVMCKLMIDGKEYGIHAFIVQLRSLENHRVVPGKLNTKR